MTRSKVRIASLLLAVILLLSCAPSALADEGESTASPASTETAGTAAAEAGLIDSAALDTWMDDYVALNGLGGENQRFSVGFCYTGTGDCWFYHGDDWMYSASLYKVPVSMLMAEKEAAGELSPDTVITNSQGTGTFEKLESTALILSNNTSGHIMVEYLGGTYNGKCADQTTRFTPLEESYFSEEDFSDLSYYTARYMTYVMKTLFEGGDETFPHVEEYLKQAQPGEYYNTDPVLSQYGVAQKYGAFVEQNGNNNNHCAAIIYTPTPIIVVVMTRNVGDYQRRIGEVGAHLAEVALQLDEKKAALEQEEEDRARAEAQAGCRCRRGGRSGCRSSAAGKRGSRKCGSGPCRNSAGCAGKIRRFPFHAADGCGGRGDGIPDACSRSGCRSRRPRRTAETEEIILSGPVP